MAVVGDAYIVVRAITNRVRPDIENALKGLDGIGERAGRDISDGISRGANRGGGAGTLFSKKFEADLERNRIKLRQLTQVGFFLGPALAGVAGALGAVGAGLVTVGSLAGVAAQSGFAILGSAITSLLQSLLTLGLAFAGVGSALQAGLKAQKGNAAAAKAQEAAAKALARAQLQLARILEDRPDNIAEIVERAADADRAAADAALSATRATRAYNDAQKRTKRAIDDLNRSREEAVERLQQLRFETEGGAISEKKARLEFEKARDALQRVQDLPPNSRARREAELAFAEADLNLRKAIDRNKDLKKEEAAATKAGVEGAREVVAAKEALAQAQQSEADAGIDAARAQQDALRARAEANQAAADLKSGKAFRELDRQLADARQAVKDAKEDVADAAKGGGVDAFNDALKELSPEAQRFVKFLISIQGEIKKLRAAAGRELFPRLEIAIQNLVDNLFPRLEPLLEGTGKVLGDVAINLSKVITDADNLKSLENVWKTNDKFIGNLGTSVGNLYTGFLNLLEAAGPLILRFGEWLEKVTGTWAETRKLQNQSGELTKKFNRFGDILANLGGALKPFWQGLKDIFAVITEEGGAIDVLTGYLKEAGERFRDFTSAGREDGSLKTFFNDATENFTKVLSLIGNIVAELLKLGDNKGVGDFTDSLNRATDTFGRIGENISGPNGPVTGLGLFIEKFALLTEKLTETGSLNAFFSVLNGALDVLNTIFGNEIVQKIFAFIAPIIGVAKGLGLVLRTGQFIGKALLGTFVKVFGFIKDPFAKLRAGSGLTRAELKKQMVVDKQKQLAMKGVFVSGQQAARGINLVGVSSKTARGLMAGSIATDQVKKKSLFGLAAAGNVAKTAVRGLGRAFLFLGGPIGILFLILPLIIENWDKIVAFFKDLIPKLGKIFSDLWNGITTALSKAWEGVTSWFTGTFLPGIGNFFKKALDIITWILFPLPRLIIKFWPQIVDFFTKTVFPWFTALPGRVLQLAGKIWEFISTGIRNVWNAVTGYVTGTLIPFITGLPQRFINGAGKIWEFVSTGIRNAWSAVTGYVTNTLIPFITGLPGRFINGAGKIWDFIRSGIGTVWTGVTSFFNNTILGFVKGIPGKFTSALSGLWNFVSSGLKSAWDSAKSWWNSNVAGKGLTLGGFKIGNFQVPKIDLRIPRLAQGGIVQATPGGIIAQIGEGGKNERVEPLDSDGLSKRDKAMIDYLSGGTGKGITVNVYPSQGMDERELASLVSRQLAFQMRRGAA